MKKIFLLLLLPMVLVTSLFARGVEVEYFSSSGFTFGTTVGGDVFSMAYGLWFDKHNIKDTFDYWNDYPEEDEGHFVGPYIQFDWAILPFKLNVAGRELKFGANLGFQSAALFVYSDELDPYGEIALAPMINFQARYESFDITLGWKGTYYLLGKLFDYDGASHNSFQLGFRYNFGKRGWNKNSDNNTSSNSSGGGGVNSDGSPRTRILSGSHSYIRRI